MASFTVITPDELHGALKELCEDNGYKLAFALRTGLKWFLAASHEERIAVAKNYDKNLESI